MKKNLTPQENKLLRTKIKDLDVDLKDQRFQKAIKKLRIELKNKNICFFPKIWISDDWFSPDGVPGFAVPFYILNKDLLKLEKKIIGYAEGDSEKELIKLLRHETAHALDNAFKLRLSKQRQKIFGKTSTPYPTSYIPRIHRNEFVENLGDNYAQAHPDEDWAETFSVWLSEINWRKKYRRGLVHEKLLLVDKVFSKNSHRIYKNKNTRKVSEFRKMPKTLNDYFIEKKCLKNMNKKPFFKKDLELIFNFQEKKPKSSQFLEKNKKEILKKITLPSLRKAIWKDITLSLNQNNSSLRYSEIQTKNFLSKLITEKSKRFVKEGHANIYL